MKRILVVAIVGLTFVSCRDATAPRLPEMRALATSRHASLDGATVATDRADYMPGDTVVVTGAGWQAGEEVLLVLVEEPQVHEADTVRAVADSGGAIQNRTYLIDLHDFGRSFTLTATGLTSGLTAQTTFTDGISISSVSPASGPITGGNTVLISGSFPGQIIASWNCTTEWDWDLWFWRLVCTPVFEPLTYYVLFGNSHGQITSKYDLGMTVVPPPHTPPGSLQAWVGACYSGGCEWQWFTYTYFDPNGAPVASAGGPYNASEGSAVAFNASGSSDPDGDPLIFDWFFGDGTAAGNAGRTPQHVYSDNGAFTATVSVRDDHGHTTQATATVTVANVAPSVSAIPGAEIQQGETWSASGSFTDPGADTHTGSVDWGDGTSAPLTLSGKSFSLSHPYPSDGAYTVTVSITDDDGAVGSTSAIVTVVNTAPVAAAGGPYAGSEGSAIAFNASASSDREGDPLTYDWDFGDGTAASNAGPTPFHAYADNGSFTATVTVRDDHGHATAASVTVTVANIVPAVGAVAGAEILQGETYAANGAFTDPGADTHTGSVDWGDGSAAVLALGGNAFSLGHTYSTAGTFTVAVRITDDDGGTGTTSALVTVLSPAAGAQALGGVIQNLVTQGAIPVNQATPFLSSTDAAAASLASGNVTAARGQLGAFRNKVEAAVKTGKISASVGAELIALAERVLASMGG